MTERGITVAPLSERYRFVEQAACVFNGHNAWSLSDSITSWSVPLDRLDKACHPDVTFASDLRSTVVKNPVIRLRGAMAIIRNRRNKAECAARQGRGRPGRPDMNHDHHGAGCRNESPGCNF